MKTQVFDQNLKAISEINITNPTAIHKSGVTQVMHYLSASSYLSVAHTKDRGEVSGSNIKPWKQKGTGNARAGSKRSPLWRGGGVTFGPLSTDNNLKRIPKKMLILAKQAAMLDKIESGKVKILDNLALLSVSTKNAVNIINGFGLSGRILIIADKTLENTMSLRNISSVTYKSNDANALDISSYKNIIITLNQLKSIFPEESIKIESKPVPAVKPIKKTPAKKA
jgi:large subunit ribosomal protein L4